MLDTLIAQLLAQLQPSQPIAVADVETTGVTVGLDWVCQFAAVRIEPDGRFTRYATLVNPQRAIPAEATAVHGITDAMVADAPIFAQVVPRITPLLEGAALLAFNGRFDVKFVSAEYDRARLPNPIQAAPLIDPFAIFVQREPRDLSAAVRFYTGRTHEDAHDAMADVEAALAVLVGQCERYDDLPRTVPGLAAYCKRTDPSWLDPDGRIVWKDGEARIAFGKNAGRSLKELAARDRGFLQWVMGKDFSEEVKTLCRNALYGKFPGAPAPKAGEAVVVL